jgi:cell division protein FtsB
MAVNARKLTAKEQILERLLNPVQLRVLTTTIVLIIGYAVYVPLNDQIEATSRKLAAETKRLNAAREIESLRAQYQKFKDRIPEKSDPNEWVECVLSGVRKYPLKLVQWDSEPIREVGPYKAVALRLELEGAFPELNGLLNWIETNDRLFRIDLVRIQPHRSGNGVLVMQLTVLGVMA